jgi:hypothetical protein
MQRSPYDPPPPPKRRRLPGAILSILGHGSIVAAMLWVHADTPKTPDAPAMAVSLVEGVRPAPTVTPPAPAQTASAAKPLPQKNNVRRSPAPPQPESLSADDDPKADVQAELSAAQIAGAATASSGPVGGACDMARLLQGKLRSDPLVRAAVAGSAGKAMLVWNGDWVRSQGEDGKGLAAVRESITWEIAFAPEACRTKPVHGLILLSLNDAPGSARLAVGSGEWRWSDLLGPHKNP